VNVVLSRQQTECCNSLQRRNLYWELLGGSNECNVLYFLFFTKPSVVGTETKTTQRKRIILTGSLEQVNKYLTF
jgi:hypothetical protein